MSRSTFTAVTAPPSPPPAAPVRLSTRFGEFETASRSVVSFPAGLPGFERSVAFVVLACASAPSLQCLHAVAGPPASFLAIDPRLVIPAYRCRLAAADRNRLGAERGAPLLWLALITVGDDLQAHANLRAPVVINPGEMRGFQIAPVDAGYPLRHPLRLA